MGHGEEEEKRLFTLTLQYLTESGYTINEKDLEFIQSNDRLREVIYGQRSYNS